MRSARRLASVLIERKHEQKRDFLGGVRRTTVTIAARLLQSAGLIRYRRGLIHIVDRARGHLL